MDVISIIMAAGKSSVDVALYTLDAYDIHLLFLPLAELFVRVIIIPWGRK